MQNSFVYGKLTGKAGKDSFKCLRQDDVCVVAHSVIAFAGYRCLLT